MLSTQQETTKIIAINCIASQIKLMKDFLVSFDRINALFMRLSITTQPYQYSSTLDAPNLPGGGMSYYEPSRETSRLLVAPGSGIIGWQVERNGEQLSLTAVMNGKLIDGIHYVINIKTPDGLAHEYQLSNHTEANASNCFTVQVNLADLNNPSVLSFFLVTRRDVVLVASAWEFVLVYYPPTSAAPPTP